MRPTPLVLSGQIVLAVGLAASPSKAAGRPSTEAGTPDAIASFRALAKAEAEAMSLPAEIADAVMAIESGYDPTRIGGVGEIGLMQVRPTTAAMLGFRGTETELARPPVNIHYGVTYLARAWKQASGDLCRALMKYRAGHGQEVMTPLSVRYCERARAHLASRGFPVDAGIVTPSPSKPASQPKLVSARSERFLRGAAFWAAHNARVHAISMRIEAKWRRLASR